MCRELIEHVLSFLKVPCLDMKHVRATNTSSLGTWNPDGRCGIAQCLDKSDDNWWISGENSMPCGVGAEWVSFSLSDDANIPTRVRFDRVELRIPPLPSGPLSVRNFFLESSHTREGPWTRVTPDLTTMDSAQTQCFDVGPIEAAFLRIVCTRNAARANIDKVRAQRARLGLTGGGETEEDEQRALERITPSVGFFSISFG